ncbi:hypothetical protein ACQEU3_04140 [Spirillospora sp. CA-253888]
MPYFRDHRSVVATGALLQFVAVVPLTAFAVVSTERLRRSGVTGAAPLVAQAGGLLAAAFLACSAMASWVLSRPEVVADEGLVRAFQDLAFVTGGPGHVVPLGLLVGGLAVAAGARGGLLPRWLAVVGLIISGIALASALTLVLSGAAFLLPIARFTGLIWLVATGFLLARARTEAF